MSRQPERVGRGMGRRTCHFAPPPTSNSSSMADTCWSSWCWSMIVRDGQAAAQLPQPMHLAPWISDFLHVVDERRAVGAHLDAGRAGDAVGGIDFGDLPGDGQVALESTVAARPATALAWAMVSSMKRGECAKPQMNSPSLARSTGRSLGWASRKNPSVVSAVRSMGDSNDIVRGGGDAHAQNQQVRGEGDLAPGRRRRSRGRRVCRRPG